MLGAGVEWVFLRCTWEKDIPGREKAGEGAAMQRDGSISVWCIWETGSGLQNVGSNRRGGKRWDIINPL